MQNRTIRWLVIAILLNVLVMALSTVVLMATGESLEKAVKVTACGGVDDLRRISKGLDSWRPMIQAYKGFVEHPGQSMYAVFFEGGVKFQYPPPSLLILHLFPDALLQLGSEGEQAFRRIVGNASRAAVWCTLFLSALILELGWRRFFPRIPVTRRATLCRFFLAIVLGVFFFPLLSAHSLGQIQIYLDFLVAVAVLLHLLHKDGAAGLCLGLCSLVKPQFGMVLLWGIFRRRWALCWAMSAVMAVGLGVSLSVFGWQNHADYLIVLKTIARHGELYWPNQSVNGFLNRLLQNGDPVTWSFAHYAPFNRVVYLGTLMSSLLLYAMLLWSIRQKKPSDTYRQLDFHVVVLGCTMASPVVWVHHYGILLPLCAASLPILLSTLPLGRWTGPLLAVAWMAVSNIFLQPSLIFANRWTGVLGSHVFFGGTILLAVLLGARFRARNYTVNGKPYAPASN